MYQLSQSQCSLLLCRSQSKLLERDRNELLSPVFSGRENVYSQRCTLNNDNTASWVFNHNVTTASRWKAKVKLKTYFDIKHIFGCRLFNFSIKEWDRMTSIPNKKFSWKPISFLKTKLSKLFLLKTKPWNTELISLVLSQSGFLRNFEYKFPDLFQLFRMTYPGQIQAS